MAGLVQLTGQSLFSSASTTAGAPFHALGDLYFDGDCKYRYVKAGALLVVGNMLQAPAQDIDHDQLVVAAAGIGATKITITLGTSALTANQYSGGWAAVDTGTGLGFRYRITSHPAALAAATCVLTLAASTPIQVALTGTSRVTLYQNPYNGVLQSPITTQTGACIGCAIYPIASGEYGWIQTCGPAGVLIAGTPAVGAAVVVPGTAAGAVVVDGATAATQVVGAMMVTGVDGKVLPVRLNLD